MDTKKNVPQHIRELMPPGYTRILMNRTNCHQKQTVSDAVLAENPRSKYWPAILQLAEETNSTGYAQWVAARPEKLLKVAA
jgi:hypothetical protein